MTYLYDFPSVIIVKFCFETIVDETLKTYQTKNLLIKRVLFIIIKGTIFFLEKPILNMLPYLIILNPINIMSIIRLLNDPLIVSILAIKIYSYSFYSLGSFFLPTFSP